MFTTGFARLTFTLAVTSSAMWAQWSAAVNIPLRNWTAPQQWSPPAKLRAQGAANDGVGILAAGATAPLEFVAITPCRVVDTRVGQGFTGAFGPPALLANTPRNIPIPSSACAVPASAAYSLNFTVVPPGPLIFLSAWPNDVPFPNTSVLNAPNGGIVANGAVVPSGADGGIQVRASNPTELIIDINGYYVPAPPLALTVATAGANVVINGVNLGGTNRDQIRVAPGASFTAQMNFSIGPVAGCPGCIEPVAIGIAGQANAQQCIFTGIPGAGVTGLSPVITLVAPTTPGIYFLAFKASLVFTCADLLPGMPGVNARDLFIGSIAVF